VLPLLRRIVRVPREVNETLNEVSAIECLASEFQFSEYFGDTRDELQDEGGIAPVLALQLLNNRPGTTVKDVIGVLEEARDRSQANLRRKAK
jgi:hypothetical protein